MTVLGLLDGWKHHEISENGTNNTGESNLADMLNPKFTPQLVGRVKGVQFFSVFVHFSRQ